LNGVSGTTSLPQAYGVGMLCVALIFILIPIAVGFFTLRTKPTPASPREPIPPAS
jgi:hypothetical protein